MNSKEIRIVFMGTPDFAVESLKRLVEGGYNVVAVITMPDKPAGRGQKLHYSAVKEYALSAGLKLLQPEKLKDDTFLTELRALDADLQIVVAFRMLPEAVWNMPRMGTFNLHASLLPQYRGAAPINRAIMNGDTETGVTTFFLTHDIDTGKIIMQRKTPILDSDNAGTLHDRLMMIGAEMVTDTVDAIAADTVSPVEQSVLVEDSTILRAAPKIFKEDCHIIWDKDAVDVRNMIRGLSPYPGAWSTLVFPDGEKMQVKIFDTEIDNAETLTIPGNIRSDNKKQLSVACKQGCLNILSLQLPGKKRLGVEELLRGFKIPEGSRFE